MAIIKTFGTASFNVLLRPLPRFGQIHASGSMSYGRDDDASFYKHHLILSFAELERDDVVDLYNRCVVALASER